LLCDVGSTVFLRQIKYFASAHQDFEPFAVDLVCGRAPPRSVRGPWPANHSAPSHCECTGRSQTKRRGSGCRRRTVVAAAVSPGEVSSSHWEARRYALTFPRHALRKKNWINLARTPKNPFSGRAKRRSNGRISSLQAGNGANSCRELCGRCMQACNLNGP
jgi:hypothetical protein